MAVGVLSRPTLIIYWCESRTARHFIKPRLAARGDYDADTLDMRPPLTFTALSYLLTYLRSGDHWSSWQPGRQCNYDTTSCKLFDNLTDDPGSLGDCSRTWPMQGARKQTRARLTTRAGDSTAGTWNSAVVGGVISGWVNFTIHNCWIRHFSGVPQSKLLRINKTKPHRLTQLLKAWLLPSQNILAINRYMCWNQWNGLFLKHRGFVTCCNKNRARNEAFSFGN